MVFICRDFHGHNNWFEPIGLIEHLGSFSSSGTSAGHYVCYIKEKTTRQWYRTNDDTYPVEVDVEEVSRNAYAVLYRRLD